MEWYDMIWDLVWNGLWGVGWDPKSQAKESKNQNAKTQHQRNHQKRTSVDSKSLNLRKRAKLPTRSLFLDIELFCSSFSPIQWPRAQIEASFPS